MGNMASSMKEGAMTGLAKYFFTGRPIANQHQTWRDIYTTYWKSHYKPAFFLGSGYIIYTVLAAQRQSGGKLPMVLVCISVLAWVITPIVFSPLPRWNLIAQDLRDFNAFITGRAGSAEEEIPEVVSRGNRGAVRTLYECGLSEELSVWSEHHLFTLVLCSLAKAVVGGCLVFALPAEILDMLPVFFMVLSLTWVMVLGYFSSGNSNVFLVLSVVAWALLVPLAHLVVGSRFSHPSIATRMPEYVISIAIFVFLLGLTKEIVLITCRVVINFVPCVSKAKRQRRLQECVRLCFVYFFVHQWHMMQAYCVLVANLATSAILAAIDQIFCNAHTCFVLNNELARTTHGERYMEKGATFFEFDRYQTGYDSDLSSSDNESEAGSLDLAARA